MGVVRCWVPFVSPFRSLLYFSALLCAQEAHLGGCNRMYATRDPVLPCFCLGGTGRVGVRSGHLFFCFLPAGALTDPGEVYTEGPVFES